MSFAKKDFSGGYSGVFGKGPSGTTEITKGGQTVLSQAQVAQLMISTIKTQLRLARKVEPTDEQIAMEIATLIMRIKMFASPLGERQLTQQIQNGAKELVDKCKQASKETQFGVQSVDYLTKLAILYVEQGVWLINETNDALLNNTSELLGLKSDVPLQF